MDATTVPDVPANSLPAANAPAADSTDTRDALQTEFAAGLARLVERHLPPALREGARPE